MAELFDRIEINRAPRWPMLSRLLALSVVAHGLFIVALVYVPTLRNILYLASSMSGIKFVSEDYDRTLIGRRATVIQFAPHEKLRYPPDYFGAPAVEETTQLQPVVVQQAAPPPPPVPTYRPRPVRVPRVRPTPQPSPSPEVAQATPSPTPDDSEKKQAEAEIDKIEKETGVKRPVINKQPFEDFAQNAKELFDQGKLDLNTGIEVRATGPVKEDGTLDPDATKVEWVTRATDENTARLARQLLTAISQSKMFSNLEGAKAVSMSLKLDEQNISIKIVSDLPSELDAKTRAEGYATMVLFSRIARNGTSDGEIYKGLKFNYKGSQFTMTFEMPRDAAGKIIGEVLAKKAAAAQNKS
jgi:hypothetical protein